MLHTRPQRIFSEQRHTQGRWKTRISQSRNPLTRAVWNFMSFKRSGIDTLACQSAAGDHVLDLGCGNGAYAAWFLARCPATVVAVDWSWEALAHMPSTRRGRVIRVCADARMLPFRAESFSRFFTVDTFGHIPEVERALDEMLRVMKPGACFFLHTECSDHRKRWPDKALIRVLGNDVLAELDGHWGVRDAAQVYAWLNTRFKVNAFFSPAGLLGWLIGYPEKYRIAFTRASWHRAAAATSFFAVIKRIAVAGALLRLLNALTNHIELFFGIVGGGSCFSFGTKPLAQQQKNIARRCKSSWTQKRNLADA